MRSLRPVKISKETEIQVLVSDEEELLLEAAAQGSPAIGVCGGGELPVEACRYAVENAEDIDEALLQRAAYRSAGLPLEIAETKRLRIRELVPGDFKAFQCRRLSGQDRELAGEDLRRFFCEEEFYAYIRWNYDFFDRGIWALCRKEDGKIVGIAGFCEGSDEDELGYLIFPEERKKGYAYEACCALIEYGREELHIRDCLFRIREDNLASLALWKKLCERYEESPGCKSGGRLLKT